MGEEYVEDSIENIKELKGLEMVEIEMSESKNKKYNKKHQKEIKLNTSAEGIRTNDNPVVTDINSIKNWYQFLDIYIDEVVNDYTDRITLKSTIFSITINKDFQINNKDVYFAFYKTVNSKITEIENTHLKIADVSVKANISKAIDLVSNSFYSYFPGNESLILDKKIYIGLRTNDVVLNYSFRADYKCNVLEGKLITPKKLRKLIDFHLKIIFYLENRLNESSNSELVASEDKGTNKEIESEQKIENYERELDYEKENSNSDISFDNSIVISSSLRESRFSNDKELIADPSIVYKSIGYELNELKTGSIDFLYIASKGINIKLQNRQLDKPDNEKITIGFYQLLNEELVLLKESKHFIPRTNYFSISRIINLLMKLIKNEVLQYFYDKNLLTEIDFRKDVFIKYTSDYFSFDSTETPEFALKINKYADIDKSPQSDYKAIVETLNHLVKEQIVFYRNLVRKIEQNL
ncbi:MAG: hypothetical protein K9H84_06420 [Bacteroidales bacterium]|nr:hypothetical protein [Bacteroidales bacterium]